MKLLFFICVLTIIGTSSAFEVNDEDLRLTCQAYEEAEGQFDYALGLLRDRMFDRGISVNNFDESLIETVARVVTNEITVNFVNEDKRATVNSTSAQSSTGYFGIGMSTSVIPHATVYSPASMAMSMGDAIVQAMTSSYKPANFQSTTPASGTTSSCGIFCGLKGSHFGATKLANWLGHQFPVECSQLSFPRTLDVANSKDVVKFFFDIALQRIEFGVNYLRAKQSELAS